MVADNRQFITNSHSLPNMENAFGWVTVNSSSSFNTICLFDSSGISPATKVAMLLCEAVSNGLTEYYVTNEFRIDNFQTPLKCLFILLASNTVK